MLASPAAEILRLARIGIGPFKRTDLSPLSRALLARCAAAILARAAADTLRFLGRTPLKLPFKLPKMPRASSNRSKSVCARPLSFLNCWTTPIRFMVSPSSRRIVNKTSAQVLCPSVGQAVIRCILPWEDRAIPNNQSQALHCI
jgi:hypothetical protein